MVTISVELHAQVGDLVFFVEEDDSARVRATGLPLLHVPFVFLVRIFFDGFDGD